MVFLGPKNTKLPVDLVLAMQMFGTRGEYVMLESPGANALDFHVAFHLGRLAAEDPSGFFHIISKDMGFDPLIQHLEARKVFSARSPSIEEMPCFRAASPVTSAAAPAKVPPNERHVADAGRFEELCTMAIAQLVAMKQKRPARLSTLHNAIQSKLGKDVSGSTVDGVLGAGEAGSRESGGATSRLRDSGVAPERTASEYRSVQTPVDPAKRLAAARLLVRVPCTAVCRIIPGRRNKLCPQ